MYLFMIYMYSIGEGLVNLTSDLADLLLVLCLWVLLQVNSRLMWGCEISGTATSGAVTEVGSLRFTPTPAAT
jgi:hypothetical protein